MAFLVVLSKSIEESAIEHTTLALLYLELLTNTLSQVLG